MTVLSRADLDFLLFDWLGAGELPGLAPFAGQTTGDYTAFLDLAFRLAEDEFLPCWKATDRDEPHLGPDGGVVVQPDLKRAVLTWLEAGMQLATVPEAHGGMGLPMLVTTAAMAPVMAANVAGSAFGMLSAANARVIRSAGTPEQIALFAAPQHEGRALATMCLSEPDTGSSLGDITTRALPDGQDAAGRRFRLFGRKMWISAADHDITADIVHLVLAKIADPDGSLPAGSKGISLFIVPKVLPGGLEGAGDRNDVTIAGLNHKMGYRGTPNCAVNFGEGRHRPAGAEGAVGWLLGEPGQGLPIMFQMMNEARINVGLSGAAMAARAHLLARDYARDRVQGRPLTDRKAARPVPIDRHPDVRRMLLRARAFGEGALALCLFSARLVDRAEAGCARSQALLDLLTPVTKTWPSEMGLIACHEAIQVHGGYGYTRDFDVEQLYRDSRLNPIHEGTTGIQGLDLTGRKLMGDGLAAFALLQEEIAATCARALAEPGLAGMAATLQAETARLAAALVAAQDRPLAEVMAQGTPILFAFGHLVMGWLWLDIALAATARPDRDPAVRDSKIWTCRHFYDSEMPLIAAWLAPVAAGSTLTADVPGHAL